VAILFLIPPLTALFELVPVEPFEWLLVFLIASFVFIIEEARKRIAMSTHKIKQPLANIHQSSISN
jgi:hypothetical protein